MRFENNTVMFSETKTPPGSSGGILTCRMKAVFRAYVISMVVIATASTFADFFGNTNPSTVSTFLDVDGTTFVAC